MPLTFAARDYFKSPLFNETSQIYLQSVFTSLVRNYGLKSAKGSSGREFSESRLIEAVRAQTDMPYHIHILNGLFPALKLLEQQLQQCNLIERKETEAFLKALMLGFTFHDANKLVGKELREAVNDDIAWLCERLQVGEFFPEWHERLNEIKYLALRTEHRTSAYAYEHQIHEWQFVNETLGEICHLADSFASLSEFSSTAEFYDKLCRYVKFDRKAIAEIWPLSFIEVSDNIFTLLSQKLLNRAKAYIQETREQEILFHLRNGFVFSGEPLREDERKAIVKRFCDDDSTFDPLTSTIVNWQKCTFDFIKSRAMTPEMLTRIIEGGFRGEGEIGFFAVGSDASRADTHGFSRLCSLLDAYQFPFKSVPRKGRSGEFNFFLEKSWDDLSSSHDFLTLFALQRIKFLSLKEKKEWKTELENLKKELPEFTQSITVAAALVSSYRILQTAEDLTEKITALKAEISTVLSRNTQKHGNTELEHFADSYLTGNFERDLEALFKPPMDIPEKSKMCLFTGKRSSQSYSEAGSHGIKPRGFSNRSINTLKSIENRVSSLFNSELELRREFAQEGRGKFNTCVYYDFGEYIINLDSRRLLNVLAKAKDFQHDEPNLQIVIDKNKFTYNLYGMNFESIEESVKGNFYFIQRNLKLIKATGFRIYTTSIISPYNAHKEIFVFESCMPFVKAIGWDRIRIDEVEARLQELNLFLTLGSNKLVSNVLAYAEDRRAVFSAFQELNEDDKAKARRSFTDFVCKKKEYSMSTMKTLAEMAIEMARPQSGSSSQETRIVRDSLNILKTCYKEKRDRETTVGQVVGELRQMAKTYEFFNEARALPFAEALYDHLFEKEWNNRFPQPSRLRNWINEFGFWYSTLHFEMIRKNVVQKAVDALQTLGQEITEDSAIAWLKQSDSNKKKAIDKYETDYRAVYRKYFTKN